MKEKSKKKKFDDKSSKEDEKNFLKKVQKHGEKSLEIKESENIKVEQN